MDYLSLIGRRSLLFESDLNDHQSHLSDLISNARFFGRWWIRINWSSCN